ncbi:hypothetical protein WQE_25503 [Paraburkholderia hospita]|uniref:ATP-binding protein n=1 Tax=Paraburkholderia hospita TaxID=169430 RepID=A0ABP2PK52_9BURK|nr:hypothetical protein [Paraburkholderia hospita]EIM98155.1 hypothetical protein WQE_25503 [Paraburkholderia hospita]OUL88004.1 hypothetical protein CA602_12330 [Paraburkholderia hospita]
MFNEIKKLLRESPGLKAKVIASKVGKDKSDVNKVLYAHESDFVKDDKHQWYLKPAELRVTLPPKQWLTARLFEDALLQGDSPLASPLKKVVLMFSEGSKLLLDATARLLSLCNQLAHHGKAVEINFNDAPSTLSYFDRIGFFGLLASSVVVTPSRPLDSKADKYRAGNDGVVEVAAIDPQSPDQDIPRRLQSSFKKVAARRHWTDAFTVLCELFNNVGDHSNSPIPGFAALQHYPNGAKPHIQAVFSDSGRGILGSLEPVLDAKYPDVADRIRASRLPEGVALIQEIFRRGGISSNENEARGLGLKRTGDLANKFNAHITVRQHTYEVRIHYSETGDIKFSSRLNMHELEGTHICFDFFLDGS